MPECIVRPAWPSDLVDVASIYSHYVEQTVLTLEETSPDRAAWGRRYWELAERGLPFLATEVDGRIGGYAYCAPWKTRSAYRYCVEESIYLAPWAAGRGVGGELLDQILGDCGRMGIREVMAVLTSESVEVESDSFHLHSSRKFEFVGRLKRVGHKHGAVLDTVILQRALGDRLVSGSETHPPLRQRQRSKLPDIDNALPGGPGSDAAHFGLHFFTDRKVK
ncbi:GNAT family N-acetyltransferase [Nocardia sp. A7]|uniref:GNAT family N-acetyltransferase n=1 Tax=Nocardia sp. A7 TaxID=2789274 RepID=UPI00397DCE70